MFDWIVLAALFLISLAVLNAVLPGCDKRGRSA